MAELTGAVRAMVGGRDGVRWSGSAGEARPGVAAASNTIFRIYSMTKAVGSTAATQQFSLP